MSEVMRLLHRARAGDRAALDELMPLVYGELRRIARSFMRRQQPGHTLQPTALINEAFIKLFQDAEPQLADRAHFLALMSRVMRQVLVDHARAHGAVKRGRGGARLPWDTNIEVPADSRAWTLACEAGGEVKPGAYDVRLSSAAPDTGKRAKDTYKASDVALKLKIEGTARAAK